MIKIFVSFFFWDLNSSVGESHRNIWVSGPVPMGPNDESSAGWGGWVSLGCSRSVSVTPPQPSTAVGGEVSRSLT